MICNLNKEITHFLHRKFPGLPTAEPYDLQRAEVQLCGRQCCRLWEITGIDEWQVMGGIVRFGEPGNDQEKEHWMVK